MDLLNKTLLTNNESDLKKIYEEEVQKLRENDFKLSVLKRLNIEDFPNDLPEKSKKNIDRALIAVKIRDHINLGNGQKLLGLDNFEISKLNLSYAEKKLIRERVEHLINLEKKKQCQDLKKSDELAEAQNLFIEIQTKNIELTEQLVKLKLEELELMREVAENIASPTQMKLVQGLLDECKILQLKTKIFNQVIIENETSSTRHAKKAIMEVSGYLDELLAEKQKKDKK